jgi:hypothetical protein
MRTPTACYGSTSRKAPTSPNTPPMTSTPLPPPSTTAPAKPLDGRHLPKPSAIPYARSNHKTLRPSLESGQYLSIRYTERLAEAGIEPSVRSVGDSYDNALAETINGLFETEIIHPNGPWRNFEEVEFATSNGPIGSTIGGSWVQSATSRRWNSSRCTMNGVQSRPWGSGSRKRVSVKAGAVHRRCWIAKFHPFPCYMKLNV